LPGANARGVTLEEARTNLQEAVQLVLDANRALVQETLRDKSVIENHSLRFHEADRSDPLSTLIGPEAAYRHKHRGSGALCVFRHADCLLSVDGGYHRRHE
jgi:hypothetical protein